MKKLFIAAAILAAMCSCTSESFIEIPEANVENSNSIKFDAEEENFEAICRNIVEVHKEIDVMRDVLEKNLLFRIDAGVYSLDDAVHAIISWWENDETHDLLVEWPAYDDFRRNIPQNFINKYNYYW